MTTPSRWFGASCRHCRRVIFTATRIGDAELARLRDHIRQAHTRVNLAPDADAGAILKHFDVASEAK